MTRKMKWGIAAAVLVALVAGGAAFAKKKKANQAPLTINGRLR